MLIRIQIKCAYSVGWQSAEQACIALGWMRGNEPITSVHRMSYLQLSARSGHVFGARTEHIKWHKMAKCEKEDVQSRFCGRIATLE